MKAIKTNKNNYALLLTNEEVAQMMALFIKNESKKPVKVSVTKKEDPMRNFKKMTKEFFLEIQKVWGDQPVLVNEPKFQALRKKHFIFTYVTPLRTLEKRGLAVIQTKKNGRMESFLLSGNLI
jgi:hypothetical protein